jgi:hypothetical protein
MSDAEKKFRAWPLAAVLLVGLPMMYVGSFGPACWLSSRGEHGAALLPLVYRPITWGLSGDAESESVIHDAIQWYACAGAASPHWWWSLNRYSGEPSPRWEWEDHSKL